MTVLSVLGLCFLICFVILAMIFLVVPLLKGVGWMIGGVFQGIGWGIEYRFEGSGQIVQFLSHVGDLDFGEHVAVLSGLIWTTGNRVTMLEERVASGEATVRDGDQLARLDKLKKMLEKRWRRLPVRYQQADTILY